MGLYKKWQVLSRAQVHRNTKNDAEKYIGAEIYKWLSLIQSGRFGMHQLELRILTIYFPTLQNTLLRNRKGYPAIKGEFNQYPTVSS
jgi:hypothetical protein